MKGDPFFQNNMLNRVRASGAAPVFSLAIPEYDADREEDEIVNQHGFRTGEYEHLLPNPD